VSCLYATEKDSFNVEVNLKEDYLTFKVNKYQDEKFFRMFARDTVILNENEVFLDTLSRELILYCGWSNVNAVRAIELRNPIITTYNGEKIVWSMDVHNTENVLNLKDSLYCRTILVDTLEKYIISNELLTYRKNLLYTHYAEYEDRKKINLTSRDTFKIILLFPYSDRDPFEKTRAREHLKVEEKIHYNELKFFKYQTNLVFVKNKLVISE
jgi:hypothetical protein